VKALAKERERLTQGAEPEEADSVAYESGLEPKVV